MTQTQPTHSTKPEEIKRKWHLVDARGKVLGRLASEVAQLLRGKHKSYYVPHLDVGDFVVVTNAQEIEVTGKKKKAKKYYRHSGYPGGLKEETFAELLKRRPTEVIRRAVKGMLPQTRLGRRMIKKLRVYQGEDHPHRDKIGGDKKNSAKEKKNHD